MKTPFVSVSTINFTAAKRFTAASEDGLSYDLCDPTRIIGIEIPDSANDKNAEL